MSATRLNQQYPTALGGADTTLLATTGLQRVGTTYSLPLILQAKNDGEIQISTAGITRGTKAVDLQVTGLNTAQVASGQYSFVTGQANTASGYGSVAAGYGNTASYNYAVAMGSSNISSAVSSVAFGSAVHATGNYSFACGYNVYSTGSGSHAVGTGTIASGGNANAEGAATTASGNYSHAEGYSTLASGTGAHAEGYSQAGMPGNSGPGGEEGQYGADENPGDPGDPGWGGDSGLGGNGIIRATDSGHAEGFTIGGEGGTGGAGGTGGNGGDGNSDHANFQGGKGGTGGRGGSGGVGGNAIIEATAAGAHAEGYVLNANSGGVGGDGGLGGNGTPAYDPGDGWGPGDAGTDGTTGSTGTTGAACSISATGLGAHAEGFVNTGLNTGNIVSSGNGSHAEGMGIQATADGAHSEGQATIAAGVYSHAEGNGSKAFLESEHAHAAGAFTATGDAELRRFVCRLVTTNSTPAEMLINGTTRLTLPNDTTWAFHIQLAVRRTDADNESAAFEIVGAIDRNTNAASTALVGTPTVTTLGSDNSGTWSVAVTADTSNGSLKITATGANSKNIRWVATVHVTQVTG